MKELHYDKDRVAQARDLRARWYKGEKTGRTPFIFNVPAPVSNGWLAANPYSFREIIADSAKAVEGNILSIQHQLETFPDCDYLPMMNTFYFGEGILASMYGAEQQIEENVPPFTKGRFFKDIRDAQRIHNNFDVEATEWGAKLKEHTQRFVEATRGEIPVGVADYQSPYGTATKLLPNEELMLAMYDEPELLDNFLTVVTDGIIKLIAAMERWVGPECVARNHANPIPGEPGVILWDDYISVITPELHAKHCAPHNKRLFARYGTGHLHTCGPYFPSYIDACLASEPRSMDVTIMRGFGKTREDLFRFCEIATQNNILLLAGWMLVYENSVFEKGAVHADDDLWAAYVRGGHMPMASGSFEDGIKFKETVNRLRNP